MCAVPTLVICGPSTLARSDFPELDGYGYLIKRASQGWEIEIHSGLEGCLCEDPNIAGVVQALGTPMTIAIGR